MLKIALLSIIVSIFNSMNPEEYLNKRIETIFPFYEKYLDHDKNNNYGLNKIKYVIPNGSYFLGKEPKYLRMVTNKENYIEGIYFYFDEQIDSDFYNKLIDNYGEPDYMFKMGEIIQSDVTITEGGDKIGYGKTNSLPCTFEENPLFIGWNKEKFKITIRFNYAKNRTSISFTSKDEE